VSSMWLGMDPTMNTTKTCVSKRLDYAFKIGSRLNSEHNRGGPI
jgi:hypothetical protein